MALETKNADGPRPLGGPKLASSSEEQARNHAGFWIRDEETASGYRRATLDVSCDSKSSLNVFMELFGGELSPGGEERPESPRMLSCLSPTNGDEGRNDGAAMP